MKIRIGTRKSKLALAQTQLFTDTLHTEFPKIEIEIVEITTKGDMILNRPLSSFGGKGTFSLEIEKALQQGKIDAAVHSAKDLPFQLADDLIIAGVLRRGNYRDVLVTPSDKPLSEKRKAIIGTGSLRRRVNFKKLFPNAEFKEIRGNVDTRLKKLKCGEYDGIILAAAGLERLGLNQCSDYNFTSFDYDRFLPAPCQGIIAIEAVKNSKAAEIIQAVSHKDTFICFETERAVSNALGSDCSDPLGVYSEICGDEISLTVSLDGSKSVQGKCEISDRFKLVKELTSEL
ncbi:MAG: hydroxymethylbilane synthase [Oscillospiraceae bacterium]